MYKELRKLFCGEQIDQKEIGQRLGRSTFYVSQRMTGKKPWNMDDVYAICEWLDIPVSEISIYFPKGGRTVGTDKAS